MTATFAITGVASLATGRLTERLESYRWLSESGRPQVLIPFLATANINRADYLPESGRFLPPIYVAAGLQAFTGFPGEELACPQGRAEPALFGHVFSLTLVAGRG
jgi:hypothetical protein